MSDISRRRCIAGTAAAVAGVALWQPPVVQTLVLPAHAQTSPAIAVAAGLFSIDVRTRTPSGGTPVPAIHAIDVRGCLNVGTTLQVSAIAFTSATSSLPLGNVSAPAGPAQSTVTLTVPATTVAAVSAVTRLEITASNGTDSQTQVVTGAPLTALLTGATSGYSC